MGPGNSCDYSYRCSFVGDLVDMDKVVAAATGRDAEGEEIFYSRTLDWNEKLNIHAFAEAVPKGPVRKLVANMQENSNVNDLLQYSTIGAGVFVVFIAVVLKIRTCVQIAEEKLEYVLVTAAGVISMAVLLAYALNLKVYFLSTKISETQNSGLSDLSNSAKNGSACPVKLTQVIGSTTQNIGGCTLYKLSAVDKIALHSAGDVHCDCTFLEVRELFVCNYFRLCVLFFTQY